ncbi:MAG: hypothetical protein U9M97_01450, partial [Candidatus Hadarchaeota archaeon]|nr:hypothetical protein [Candidatus Hadarchaeota archaeon]
MNLPVVNVGMIGHVDHGKCVSLNDFILLNNNVLTGGDLVKLAEEKGVLVKEENEGKFYDVGLHAYCLNDKLDFVKSKAFVYIQPYSGEMIAVRTASGRELTTTPNHPFLINRGGKLGWVQANKLVTSDYISVLKKADFSGEMEFGDYVDDLSREYVVIDSRKFEDLREKTKSFTEFDRCTDEEVNELRVLYKLSGAKLAREVGVTRQYLTNSFNVEGLSKPLREKILGVFFVLPKPKLESNELITCSKKDSGNVLSFRDAPLSPDLMKWIAFVCAEGGKGKERLRVTQKTYLNLMKDFFDISLREFGIKFRKISGIDYEFCGRAFIRYLDKKFDVVPGTS